MLLPMVTVEIQCSLTANYPRKHLFVLIKDNIALVRPRNISLFGDNTC